MACNSDDHPHFGDDKSFVRMGKARAASEPGGDDKGGCVMHITHPDQLEAGRQYWVRDKDDSGSPDVMRCLVYDEQLYFGDRIWATPDNPQAFERWDIIGPINEPYELFDALTKTGGELPTCSPMANPLEHQLSEVVIRYIDRLSDPREDYEYVSNLVKAFVREALPICDRIVTVSDGHLTPAQRRGQLSGDYELDINQLLQVIGRLEGGVKELEEDNAEGGKWFNSYQAVGDFLSHHVGPDQVVTHHTLPEHNTIDTIVRYAQNQVPRPLRELVNYAEVVGNKGGDSWDRVCRMAEATLTPVAEHMQTWGPNCGAPRSVYLGHLVKLLLECMNQQADTDKEGVNSA